MAKKPAKKKAAKAKPAPSKKAPPAKKKAATKPAVEKKTVEKEEPAERQKTTPLMRLKIDQMVIVDGFNVREDMGDIDGLAQSIAAVGIKRPLRGYQLKDGEDAGKWMITDGQRRYLAGKIVVKKQPSLLFPFQPEEAGYSVEDRTLDILLTNDGKPLTMLEQAEAVQRLINYGWDRKDIATKWGKTDQHISDLEVLLTANTKLKKMVKKNEIAPSNLIEVIKEHKGDMEKVEGTLIKAQVKAGAGKKIKPKHIDRPKKKAKPTLGDLKDLRTMLEDSKPEGRKPLRLETFDLIVAYLSGETGQKEFLDDFWGDK